MPYSLINSIAGIKLSLLIPVSLSTRMVTKSGTHYIADTAGAKAGQEIILKRAALLDYKSFRENDKLRCKQRKRILLCFGLDFLCLAFALFLLS